MTIDIQSFTVYDSAGKPVRLTTEQARVVILFHTTGFDVLPVEQIKQHLETCSGRKISIGNFYVIFHRLKKKLKKHRINLERMPGDRDVKLSEAL